jgi:hypothetical protein
MFDFSSLDGVTAFPDVIAKIVALAPGVSKAQLRDATNASVDHLLGLLKGIDDGAVVFVPRDEGAFDEHAAPEHQHDGWTFGHVIVHMTASSEESAFVAAELARGVEYHGRSRYETAWETITTVAQCRQRLDESRRMRLATLEIWPDAPHVNNTFAIAEGMPQMNATARFLMGLRHESGHIAQAEAILAQASAK